MSEVIIEETTERDVFRLMKLKDGSYAISRLCSLCIAHNEWDDYCEIIRLTFNSSEITILTLSDKALREKFWELWESNDVEYYRRYMGEDIE